MKKEFRLTALAVGILSIIAGIYMFISPIISLASFSFFFAAVMFINGVYEIIHYFADKEDHIFIVLLNGIITILLSILVLSSPLFAAATLIPYLFACWILFSGITRFIISFKIRYITRRGGFYLLLIGILGIICGIVMLMHPLFTSLFVAYMIGFDFIYHGIISIVLFFRGR